MPGWEARLDDQDRSVYPIGVVADLLNTNVQALRRYDSAEIVQPERSDGGQRRYSRRDVERLARVLSLAEEGIPANGIKRILDLEQEIAQARHALAELQEEQAG